MTVWGLMRILKEAMPSVLLRASIHRSGPRERLCIRFTLTVSAMEIRTMM